MMKMRIHPTTFSSKPGATPYLHIRQADVDDCGFAGASLVFNLDHDAIKELREAADKAEAFLARNKKEAYMVKSLEELV